MPAAVPSVPPPKRWTVDEVRAMHDPTRHWPRYELIGGELLVTNAPKLQHQRAIGLLRDPLAPYVKAQKLGEVLLSPSGLELIPGTYAQPDLFVVPLIGGRLATEWDEVKSLLLAVEVLSPSTARYDRVKKRHHFAEAHVPEYWIVDLDARLVERWRPEEERPEVIEGTLTWPPAGARGPFALDLARFFATVHGEEG